MRLPEFALFGCESCGSWTCLPRPSASEQAKVHDSGEYFDHPYFKLRRDITRRQRQRCREIFERLSCGLEIGTLHDKRILDVGCDTGIFLAVAQEEFGIVPIGLDVARRAVEEALKRGVEAYAARIEEAPAALIGFPLVTAIDVLEHVADPAAFLHQVRTRLQPGGVLYLETPNIRSVVYRFGKLLSTLTGGRPLRLFERLFPPQHIQYFTSESLALLARNAGFDIVRLGTRILPREDIAAGRFAQAPIAVLQALDRLAKTEILIWAVLRRGVQET